MISSIYAGISALLLVWLSLNVIKLRRANKVRLGDGGVPELQNAIRAHGNAAEYIPIALILLYLLEAGGAYTLLVHLGGVCILLGRSLHAKGLLTGKMHYRIAGMQITIFTLAGMGLLNVIYGFLKWLN